MGFGEDIMDEDFVSTDGLRCDIQTPSGTGRRTAFEGGEFRYPFWPVEEVRGGIALGERRCSDGVGDGIDEGPTCERFRWNMERRSIQAPI